MTHYRAILEKAGVKYHFLWTSTEESAPVFVTRVGLNNVFESTREHRKNVARGIWTILLSDGFVMVWKGEDYSASNAAFQGTTRDLTERRTKIADSP